MPGVGPDSAAILDQLFARASAGNGRSIQEIARLVIDGLLHAYAIGQAARDHTLSVRALRELRAMLEFHARVDVQALEQLPGWARALSPLEVERGKLANLERLLLAQLVGSEADEAEAMAALGWAPPSTSSNASPPV